MSLTFAESSSLARNPLDLLEEIVGANDWPHERASGEELAVEISGRWCDYRLFFMWQEDMSALHFTCLFESRMQRERRADIQHLLALVNEKLWLGHFDLSSEEGTPSFRHTLLFRGAGAGSVEQLEDLVDVAISESDRYYPAFQFVMWGGKSAEDAIAAALIEVAGSA